MARALAQLPSGTRMTDYIGLGVVAKYFPLRKVQSILRETGKSSVRQLDLPAHVVVYYVIALALYMQASYRELLRCLLEELQWLIEPTVSVRVTDKSGISRALTRLGWEPLKALYESVVMPIAEQRTRDAWYRQRRLVSLSGSTLDVADTAENEEAFERPGASRGASAYCRSGLWRCWRTARTCYGLRRWRAATPKRRRWPNAFPPP